MINVGELIYDPDFCQIITIVRNETKVVDYKEVLKQSTFKVTGIITVDNKSAEMQDAADWISGQINVFTKDALKVSSKYIDGSRYIGDVVLFEGKNYKVDSILPDMQYGFCKSICTLIERN